MKRVITTLVLAGFFMSSFAQITVVHDTVSGMWTKDGAIHPLKDTIINNTGAPITIVWQKTFDLLLTGWTGYGICDKATCYGYDNASHTFVIDPGEKVAMYVDMKAIATAADGNNYVTLKLNDGTGTDKFLTYRFFSWPAQLKDYENNNIVSVYPNPATNFININILDTRVSAINVVNIIGKRVYHYDIVSTTPNPIYVPLDNIARGIYMLQFTDGNGKLLGVKRVTKQ